MGAPANAARPICFVPWVHFTTRQPDCICGRTPVVVRPDSKTGKRASFPHAAPFETDAFSVLLRNAAKSNPFPCGIEASVCLRSLTTRGWLGVSKATESNDFTAPSVTRKPGTEAEAAQRSRVIRITPAVMVTTPARVRAVKVSCRKNSTLNSRVNRGKEAVSGPTNTT